MKIIPVKRSSSMKMKIFNSIPVKIFFDGSEINAKLEFFYPNSSKENIEIFKTFFLMIATKMYNYFSCDYKTQYDTNNDDFIVKALKSDELEYRVVANSCNNNDFLITIRNGVLKSFITQYVLSYELKQKMVVS